MRPLVVIGDSLLDIDLTGQTDRLCADAPVPVLDHLVERSRPGGGALAAAMAARDGYHVTLLTAFDDAEAGRELASLLTDVEVIRIPFRGSTAVKRRVRAGGQSLLRLDSDDGPGVLGTVPAEVKERIAEAGAVLVSDYGRGVPAHAQIRDALSARPARVPLVWDPHPRGAAPVPGAALVTPNDNEADLWAVRLGAAEAAGPTDLARSRERAQFLVQAWAAHAVAVTLGSRGALMSYGDGAPALSPAPPVPTLDPCGAGDRFAVSATLSLASGCVTTEAVQAGVESASAFVRAGGATAFSASQPRQPAERADADPPALTASVRRRGGTVVATGGCFDLLHAGHVATLRAARRLGDCLVVLVNSDESVRRLKGPGRPLVPVADRVHVLQALECVDGVVVFDEDTPNRALADLRPDIWAKGGDYAGRELPEMAVMRDWGGQAVALPYLGGHSTSDLVRTAALSTAHPSDHHAPRNAPRNAPPDGPPNASGNAPRRETRA